MAEQREWSPGSPVDPNKSYWRDKTTGKYYEAGPDGQQESRLAQISKTVQWLDQQYREKIAQPATGAVSQMAAGLNILRNPFSGPPQPGTAAQFTGRMAVPQNLTELAIQGATLGAGSLLSPAARLGPAAAQALMPRLGLGAARIAAPTVAGGAVEGLRQGSTRGIEEGALSGLIGGALGEAIPTVTRLGRRFIQGTGGVYPRDAAALGRAAKTLEPFAGEPSETALDLAKLGGKRGRDVLIDWYGKQIDRIGGGLPKGLTFSPGTDIPQWNRVLDLAGRDYASLKNRPITWSELADVYSQIGRKAASKAERQTVIAGKPTNLKEIRTEMTRYLEKILTPYKLTGMFANARSMYTRASAMRELMREGIIKAGSGGYEFNTRALQNLLANPDKGDALLQRLGADLGEQVTQVAGRGAGRGFSDITKEGPTTFLTSGGPLARIRAYGLFPEFVGYPTRPYEVAPAKRAAIRYGTQALAGKAILPPNE